MPGNRALYDRAMEQSREAARLKQWDEALKQSARALQEFAQDADAKSVVAVALFHLDKHDKALEFFQELQGNDATNPFYFEYIARIHERSGRAEDAIATYTALAELQQQRRLGQKALEALREAARIAPTDADTRARIAQLLADNGNPAAAADELIELARLAEAQGDADLQRDAAEAALRFDATNNVARDILGLNAPPPEPSIPPEALVASAQRLQEVGDLRGALEQYQQAVAGGLDRSDLHYNIGLLHQELGEQRDAIASLRRAATDGEYAMSAHYALGSAHRALGELPQAAQEYEQTIRLVDLETIGRAESEDLIQMYEGAVGVYNDMGDVARAASLYSTLASFFASKRWGKERADEFRRKARELTERNMFAKLRLMGTGALTAPTPVAPEPEPEPSTGPLAETWGKIRPITDFLRPGRVNDTPAEPQAPVLPPDPIAVLEQLPSAAPTFAPLTPLPVAQLDEVSRSYITASEKYVETGLILAALDACHEVIRLHPDYLPIHVRLGEIYERDQRSEQALAKYQLLVEAYAARGTPTESVDALYKVVSLAPDSVNQRMRLAEILKEQGKHDAAAEQVAFVAASHLRAGQTNRALEEYRRGLNWAPASASLRTQYGQALLKLERNEAALAEFRRAFELKPEDPAGIARINLTLAIMGEQPTAIWQSLATLLDRLHAAPQHFATVLSEYRAVLLLTDAPLLHYTLGIIEQHAGHHQSALFALEQAAALMDRDEPILSPVLVYQALADSHIALGQAEDALAQLRLADQAAAQPAPPLEPAARHPFSVPLSRGELVRRMAEAYAASDDLPGAERALQEAKRHIPYDRAIYTKLADVYFRQGKLTEALAQLDELATYYEGRQDLDKAIESLDYALVLAPNNIPLVKRAAELNLRRGYLDKGVDGLVRGSELMRKAGQIKDAVASLQKAAEVHWTLGQHAKARELYNQITKVAPNDIEARQWLSFMYTLAGNIGDAIREKQQIVSIHLQQREYDGAIAELHQIYGLDQNNHETLFQLADVLMRRGEYNQALRTYQRLAKIEAADKDRLEALQAAAKRMLAQQQAQQPQQPVPQHGPAEG